MALAIKVNRQSTVHCLQAGTWPAPRLRFAIIPELQTSEVGCSADTLGWPSVGFDADTLNPGISDVAAAGRNSVGEESTSQRQANPGLLSS